MSKCSFARTIHFGHLVHRVVFSVALLLGSFFTHAQVDISDQPLFLAQPAKPIVMLSMSVDHELFKKAYNDYSNLEGGLLSITDTTYRNDFTYYGYFDSGWCYTYQNSGYFEPASAADNHQCAASGGVNTAGAWSGNFLNWASMTRMDIVRQVLYGGKRSTDSKSRTVLERAHLPTDVHAFVKVYSGSDISQYTPYTETYSFCNVSDSSGASLIRSGRGSWPLWSIGAGYQCRWADDGGNWPEGRPNLSSSGSIELTARVEVCTKGKDAEESERCKLYESSTDEQDRNYKPIGLLQRHGETGKIRFGLVTGSYKANLQGGVLRKGASLVGGNPNAANDEVNLGTGQFNNVDGIISNVDALQISSYDFNSFIYTDCNTYSIPIATIKDSNRPSDRLCSNWGNPVGEIYLETLRYLSGAEAPTSAFNVDDSTNDGNFVGLDGLSRVTNWDDPISEDAWCTNCSIIVLSTGANSFDGDDLASAEDLNNIGGVSDVQSYVDQVGEMEFSGSFTGDYFSAGLGAERHCTATELGSLSGAVGICPELPYLEGTYTVAGLAYYARTNDLRADREDSQTVRTYAVDLAESLPSFTVPVGSGEITFLPACESQKGNEDFIGCSLFDVHVENITYAGGQPVSGSYVFYWEDSLWGNDYDIDGAQRIEFCVGSACNDSEVSSNQLKLINSIPYAVAGNHLRFSYTIAGTSGSDGLVQPWANRPSNCNNGGIDDPYPWPCSQGIETRTNIFTVGTTQATLLQKPLYYAAKFGGFTDLDGDGTPDNVEGDNREWDSKNNLTGLEGPDGIPDNYFSVSNPALLEDSLDQVLSSIVADIASGSAAAASSTQLETDTTLYQARFSSLDWSGELVAYDLDEQEAESGTEAVLTEKWSTSDLSNVITPSARQLISYNKEDQQGFWFTEANWGALSSEQQAALDVSGTGMERLRWVRGESVNGLRERVHWLGDIINSDPVYAGHQSYPFSRLPESLGGNEYNQYMTGSGSYGVAKNARRNVVYASANDGMVHAFDAETGRELFAYIPSMVYDKLRAISRTDYGTPDNPHTYLVDGPLFISDAYVNGRWRNLLVGTLGAGGRGVFVLDITDPDSINANNLVLFELTEEDYPELGYVLGQPIIAPTFDGWKLILGNGYNSDDEEPALLIIDLENPYSAGNAGPSKVLNVDESMTTGSDGLGAVSLSVNGSGIVNGAYAGDLSGNIWKFTIAASTASGWEMDYRLFTALDPNLNRQPITAAPVLGLNRLIGDDAVMVYFGTGEYFTVQAGEDMTVNSIYAIADEGISVDGPLHQKNIISENNGVRVVSGEKTATDGGYVSDMDWAANKGWYLNLLPPPPNSTPEGERVITKMTLMYDKLIFPTIVPSTASCEFGGSSWIMELIAVGDRHLNHSVLGSSGLQSDNAVLGQSNPLRSVGGDKVYLPISDIRGNLDTIEGEVPKGVYGRQSWKQLR